MPQFTPQSTREAPAQNVRQSHCSSEFLSQPSLQHSSREPFSSRAESTQSVSGVSRVADFLGSIQPSTTAPTLTSSTNNINSNCRNQKLREENQDCLSIDIDEELARLDLESFDEFPSSSAATSNHDKEHDNLDYLGKRKVERKSDEKYKEEELNNKNNLVEEKTGSSSDRTKLNSCNDKYDKLLQEDIVLFSPKKTNALLPANLKLLSSQSVDNDNIVFDKVSANSPRKIMERNNKAQVNGSVTQPGPSRSVGTRSELTIPGYTYLITHEF